MPPCAASPGPMRPTRHELRTVAWAAEVAPRPVEAPPCPPPPVLRSRATRSEPSQREPPSERAVAAGARRWRWPRAVAQPDWGARCCCSHPPRRRPRRGRHCSRQMKEASEVPANVARRAARRSANPPRLACTRPSLRASRLASPPQSRRSCLRRHRCHRPCTAHPWTAHPWSRRTRSRCSSARSAARMRRRRCVG